MKFKYVVNGKEKELEILYQPRSVILSYDGIVESSGKRLGAVYMVTFATADRSGSLVQGERVTFRFDEKPVFNVADITDDQIDAIFDDSPFVARNVLSGGAYEVVQRENADWRELITNDEPKHHGYFDTFEEAEIVRRRLHTRWVLSGA